ncbi:MAG: acyltransferase family protein [Pyrinomonadaceae bacterium]
METQKFHFGYLPELDGLRGIAILLVLFHHAGGPLINGGQIGVDVFFVLSGFLITTLLWQEHEKYGHISLKNFFIRRVLRLMPALTLLLSVFGAYIIATKSGGELKDSAFSMLYALLYVSDFALALGYSDLGALSHTWSLAIEEHFYLLYPPILVFFLAKKMSRSAIFHVFAGLMVVIAVNRLYLWGPTPGEVSRVFYGFDTHADGLMVGCLLGLSLSWGRLPPVKWYLSLAAGICLFFAIAFLKWDSSIYAYGLPIINLSTAFVIAYAVTSRPAWLANNKPLVWIGRISYGLYLWHHLIFIVVRQRVTDSPWGILVVGSLVSISCAALSFYLLERPCLRLKARFVTGKPPKDSVATDGAISAPLEPEFGR